jgi:hypothetical protein
MGQTSGYNIGYATSNLVTNQWYFIVVTHNGIGGPVAIYKDGIKVVSGTHNGAPITDAQNLILGNFNAFYRPFDGKIDNLLLLNQPLTDNDVTLLYERTRYSSISYPELFATQSPTFTPTATPNASHPTGQPSNQPSSQPSSQPTSQPSIPTSQPTSQPSIPTSQPTSQPSNPTSQPTCQPSRQPTRQPSDQPTCQPSRQPTRQPSDQPTRQPSRQPSSQPFGRPTSQPTRRPSSQPSLEPTSKPSTQPSCLPTTQPSSLPTQQPTSQPSRQPTFQPISQPTSQPTQQPISRPTSQPTEQPTLQPTGQPTRQPAEFIPGTLRESLVAYYPFDGNANDNSGNGNNGNMYNVVSVTNRYGENNKALYFNGVSSFVDLGSRSEWTLNQDFTVAFWFRADVIQYGRLCWNGENGNSLSWIIMINQNSKIIFEKYGFGDTWLPSVTAPINTWIHVAVQVDNNGMGLIYINGNFIASRLAGPSFTLPNPSTFVIGRRAGGGDYYRGSMDELYVYNRLLNASEIYQLYIVDGQLSNYPTSQPTSHPSTQPMGKPSSQPSRQPTIQPSMQPTAQPSAKPSRQPSSHPSSQPSALPR